MKLLVISSASVHLLNFLNMLKNSGRDFEVYVVTNHTNQIQYRTYSIDFSLRNPVKFIFNIIRLSDIIKKTRPDIIHIHQANAVALVAHLSILLSGYKLSRTILTAWGSDVLIVSQRNIFLKYLVKYVLKKSNVITYDAKIVGEKIIDLVNNIDKNKIKFFTFGINIPKYTNQHLKENIIYSNRLHKKLYRIDKIIDAFAIFSKNNPEWKLIIAASGDETENLKQKILNYNLSDKIQLVGWLDKESNYNWYIRSKIYVSIPESDAGSISLLESMACGCFCIVSKIPANIEIVTEENGYLVDNVNEDFFTPAINNYYSHFDPVKTYNKVKPYSVENQTQNLLSIYQNLLND